MRTGIVVGIFLAIMTSVGSIPVSASEGSGNARLTTEMSKGGARVEILGELVFGDKRQNDDIWRVYQAVYRELLRNGWRLDKSGDFVGTIEFEHEVRMRGTVTHVRVRVREVCVDPLFNTFKADRGSWEEQAVNQMERCIVDAGYWKR